MRLAACATDHNTARAQPARPITGRHERTYTQAVIAGSVIADGALMTVFHVNNLN